MATPGRGRNCVVRGDPHRTHRGSLLSLAIGAFLAPAFTFTPLLQYMGWFFGSLCHEMGHCAMAWLAGCPSFPAISLAGHAMARYSDQQIALALLMWGGAGGLAWHNRHNRRLLIVFGLATLLYPAFAFTDMRDFLLPDGRGTSESWRWRRCSSSGRSTVGLPTRRWSARPTRPQSQSPQSPQPPNPRPRRLLLPPTPQPSPPLNRRLQP